MNDKISKLHHIKKSTRSGGVVYVLDNGAVIDSEAEAMIQALHSRSVGGFENHLKILVKKGASNFMQNFYVGYGHKSIGDCGSMTIFIENVSLLTAKAIQDSKLYSGQEASTRYIDFSKQKFINPLNTKLGDEILEKQRNFYLEALEFTVDYLLKLFPKKADEDKKIHLKAIKARAFDICRGFLPAGTATNLAWHSNLRQIADRLLFLRHHPLAEVREIALTIENAVIEKYPSSFSKKRYDETEKYQKEIAQKYYYHDKKVAKEIQFNSKINKLDLLKFEKLFTNRPLKNELPKFISDLGTLEAKFKIDFGSFRDLQRHRSISQRMPLLTFDLGFNDWYIDNLPSNKQKYVKSYLKDLEKDINNLKLGKELKQYYIPIGYNTANCIVGDIPAMVYLVELRGTRFVHPTLRSIAIKIANHINKEYKIPIYFDKDFDRFDITRGKQDIILK